MDAETILGAAVLKLQRERPYLSAALWAVRRVRAPGLGTLAVDAGWRLYYDPAALERWDVDESAGVVYHEACHLLREHAARGEYADSKGLWNLAADAEINDDIRREGFDLPDGAIYPWSFGLGGGGLAESYYAALLELPDPPPATGPAAGRCGGAATGEEQEDAAWLGAAERVRDALKGGHGGALDADGLPPPIGAGEQEVIRRRVARDIDDHARAHGTVPGHLARWAAERLDPRVDWRRELAALVRRGMADAAGLVDYTYSRPSRRQAAAGRVILPSLRRPVPRVAVVVDTSGSMTAEMLAVALGEVRGILAAVGARDGLEVLSVDAAVNARHRVTDADAVRLVGGGGTDMGVGLAAAARLRPRPEVVVVITDGYTPWPDRAPAGTRTVVILTDELGTAPPWARTVVVPPDAATREKKARRA